VIELADRLDALLEPLIVVQPAANLINAFASHAELLQIGVSPKIGWSEQVRLRERVVKSLKTTFASHYTKTVSLTETLDLANIAVYGKRATGEKYLINPNKV